MNGLDCHNVTVRFGGVEALRDVDLRVEAGEIRGVIGPNGSGKTTLLNAICGFVQLQHGSVALAGQRIDRLPPHVRSRRGISRTFQGATVFGELNAVENVLIGMHNRDRHSFPIACVPIVHERFDARNRVDAVYELSASGLRPRAEAEAASLSYGEQRRLDVSRASASRSQVLLLDEPAAGLHAVEVKALEAMVRSIAGRGATIVLVEHHMALVMRLCARITVLDFGRKIAEGSPAEVQSNDAVVQAYLGTRR